ncbi:hypothetical protein LSAT2_022177 [Lamellibrachia satsuma]|nr:hypothetical protein LSAT2_022177 [Lamellibrachia satsuma]
MWLRTDQGQRSAKWKYILNMTTTPVNADTRPGYAAPATTKRRRHPIPVSVQSHRLYNALTCYTGVLLQSFSHSLPATVAPKQLSQYLYCSSQQTKCDSHRNKSA